jgi:hypothetical protein
MVAWAAETPGAPGSVQHPAAPSHLPAFMTAPGETDVLMVGTAIFLGVTVVLVGILFLHLHTLPERMAHKSQKLQFEIVAVLGLLALFTHIHLFWVAGLFLALIEIPDFSTPLRSMAGSLAKMAGLREAESEAPTDLKVDAAPQSEHDLYMADTPPSPPARVRPTRSN